MTAAAAEKTAPIEFGVTDQKNAVLTSVQLDRIDVPDSKTLDAREVEALANNIERVGLIHQPVVMRTSDRRFTVITGRRRVAALQLLADRRVAEIAEQHKTTPDRVLDNRFENVDVYVRTERKTSAEDIAALVLSENAMRSANVLGELRSINVLMTAGHDAKEIAKRTGQHVSWIRHRIILNKLAKPAMTLFETGRMRFETAQRLARLDAEQQKRVVAAFREKSKGDVDAVLSMSDISVGTSRPTRALPAAMFAPLPPVGDDPNESIAHNSPSGSTGYAGRVEPTQLEDAARELTLPANELSAAEALAMLPPATQLSVISARLEVLVALMPDVASRDAIKRARSRVLVGRDAIGGAL